MSQYLTIHPDNPQPRLLEQAAAVVRQSGVIVYPTDSSYAIGCRMGDKESLDRIRMLRKLPATQHMTMVCRDLSEIGNYAVLDNSAFRMMKSLTPGPFTFVLKAKRDVPKRLQDQKRRTIGIRVPDNRITQGLLDAMGEPLISISLVLPEQDLPENEPELFIDRIGKQVDVIVDGGAGGLDFTTVIDMTTPEPSVMREGKGFDRLALEQA